MEGSSAHVYWARVVHKGLVELVRWTDHIEDRLGRVQIIVPSSREGQTFNHAFAHFHSVLLKSSVLQQEDIPDRVVNALTYLQKLHSAQVQRNVPISLRHLRALESACRTHVVPFFERRSPSLRRVG